MRLPSVNLRHMSARSRWLWIGSGALFIATVVIWFGETAENERQIAELQHRMSALRVELASPGGSGTSRSNDPGAASRIGDIDQIGTLAADLQALSTKNGLHLSEASYKPRSGAGEGAGQVDIRVRLNGAYLPSKKVIAAMLSAHSGLALRAVSISRAKALDSQLDIELDFTFYFRQRA